MNLADYILLAVVAVCFIIALTYTIRLGKRGGCAGCGSGSGISTNSGTNSCGGCSGCSSGRSCNRCDSIKPVRRDDSSGNFNKTENSCCR